MPSGRILINTRRPPEAFEELKDYELGLIDALAVSQAVGLGKIINTAMVGAYSSFTGHPELDHLLEAVAELAPAKREANLEAVHRAFETIKA